MESMLKNGFEKLDYSKIEARICALFKSRKIVFNSYSTEMKMFINNNAKDFVKKAWIMGRKCCVCNRQVDIQKELTASDLEDITKVVYHESFGFACLKHHGIKERFEELVKEGDGNVAR